MKGVNSLGSHQLPPLGPFPSLKFPLPQHTLLSGKELAGQLRVDLNIHMRLLLPPSGVSVHWPIPSGRQWSVGFLIPEGGPRPQRAQADSPTRGDRRGRGLPQCTHIMPKLSPPTPWAPYCGHPGPCAHCYAQGAWDFEIIFPLGWRTNLSLESFSMLPERQWVPGFGGETNPKFLTVIPARCQQREML